MQNFSAIYAIEPLKWRADLREQGAESSQMVGGWLG